MPVVHRFPAPERHPRTTWSANAELGTVLHQGLSTPVAALRASVEGLVSELGSRLPRPSAIPGVLDEVELLGRNVANLIDYSRPVEPQALRCSLAELALAVARPFTPTQLARFTVAHCTPRSWAVVDGPLVVRLLRGLVENALEAGSDMVLLAVRALDHGIELGVVNRLVDPVDPDWSLEPFHTTKSNRLGLGLAIANRDARALGGTLRMELRSDRMVRVLVHLPDVPVDHGEEVAA